MEMVRVSCLTDVVLSPLSPLGRLERRGISLRNVGFSVLPDGGALQRLDRPGPIVVEHAVELPAEIGMEVVTLALGVRAVDDADRPLEPRRTKRLQLGAMEVEIEVAERGVVEQRLPAPGKAGRTRFRSALASQSEAAVTVPV
jgi:hypothetical protein